MHIVWYSELTTEITLAGLKQPFCFRSAAIAQDITCLHPQEVAKGRVLESEGSVLYRGNNFKHVGVL